MSQKELTVKRREDGGKSVSRRLRAAGSIPAVLYGHKQAPVSLTIDHKEISDLVLHSGTNSMLVLKGDGGGETAFIKSLQRHPVRGIIQTVDLIRVSRNEKITVTVPLHVEGEQADVKSGDGVLVQSLHEVHIVTTPANIPDAITADISNLELSGAALTLGDLQLPAGAELVDAPDTAVAAINLPDREEEVEADATAEADAPTAEAGEEAASEAEETAADES